VKLKRLKIPALCVRDVQLSAPTTIVHNHFKVVKDERKVVELAIYAGYLTGYHRYYHVGSKYGQRLEESNHPFLEMYWAA